MGAGQIAMIPITDKNNLMSEKETNRKAPQGHCFYHKSDYQATVLT